ncbi:spore germination protein (amino acid permease) [Paenibacillus taihuensis]|uniref:Spore germination protein (Amino acid permease) n=1 Tax=Paenibacillus taihuensis TaxID=1156355 RepID=A0A3D9R1C1_9BACL|nr:endospore germination permease [Paenibacillus taihuensis]REE68091.1 spore germination protein (amino acid permease) [Paenibacillus taihuensis]
MNVEKITPFQFGCMCFAFMSGFSTLYLLEAKLIMHDVWIAIIAATIATLFLVQLLVYIQRQFADMNLSDIIITVFGNWVGKLVLCLYLLGMTGLGVLSLRSISLFYTTAILPNTSPGLIMAIVLLVTTYAAYLGLSSISRAALVILPFFAVAMLVISVFIFDDVESNPFMPQFQNALPLIVYSSMISFGFPFGKTSVFAFVFSEITNQKKLVKSCTTAAIFSCVYLLMSTYLAIGCLGEYMFKTAAFPFFSSIQLVKFGENIERIEIMIIGIWTILTLFEIIIVQYCFVKIVGRIFGAKNLSSLYLPVGAIFFAVSMKSFDNPAKLVAYDVKILPFSIILPSIILPLILGCILWVKKSRKNQMDIQNS